MSNSTTAAAQFCTQGRIVDVQPYGEGNLNDTYLVTLEGASRSHFILQRINTHVFQRPRLIMLNLRALSDHVQQRLAREESAVERRWVVPAVLPTVDGADYIDSEGGFWRALSFVEGSRCYQTVQSHDHAREAGYALGRFHSLISDLDPEMLHDTLEGFHVTPRYLQHYDEVVARRSPRLRWHTGCALCANGGPGPRCSRRPRPVASCSSALSTATPRSTTS